MSFERTDKLLSSTKWHIDMRTTIDVNEARWKEFKNRCKEKKIKLCDVLDALLQDWFNYEDSK